MLKYIHTIRLSQGWKNYDKQFRLRKWQDPISSWALIDQELWLLYLLSKPSNSNVSSLGSGYKFIPSIIKGIVQHSFVPTRIIVCAVMGNIPFLTVPGRILIQIGLGGYHRGFNKISLCPHSGQEYQLVVLSSLQPKTFSKCTAL